MTDQAQKTNPYTTCDGNQAVLVTGLPDGLLNRVMKTGPAVSVEDMDIVFNEFSTPVLDAHLMDWLDKECWEWEIRTEHSRLRKVCFRYCRTSSIYHLSFGDFVLIPPRSEALIATVLKVAKLKEEASK